MADLDLNELERLEKAATPGPWKWDSDQIKGDPMNRCRYRVCVVGKTVMQTYYSSDDVHAETDAALTCALRNALPELLRRLRAAEADAERLRVAYELKVQDFSAETKRSSELHTLLIEVVTNLCDRHGGLPKPKECRYCELLNQICVAIDAARKP